MSHFDGTNITPEAVLQYEDIRESGETNMLDIPRVVEIAERDGHNALLALDTADYLYLQGHYGDLLKEAQQNVPVKRLNADDLVVRVPNPLDLIARRLAKAEEELRVAEELWDAKLERFREQEHELLDEIEVIKGRLAELEETRKTQTIRAWKETGLKQPHPAFGIQERTQVVYDETAMHAWAIVHMPSLLVLSDQLVKALGPELVKAATRKRGHKLPHPPIALETKVTPARSRDLSDYLQD